MKITNIGFGVTINLGQYESAKLSMEAELAPGESHKTGLFLLKEELAKEAIKLEQECKQAGSWRNLCKQKEMIGKTLAKESAAGHHVKRKMSEDDRRRLELIEANRIADEEAAMYADANGKF